MSTINIALDLIDESPTNPRKYYNPQALEELAESIKQHTVLQAVLVRPHPSAKGRYELVYGSRRFRASKIAAMPDIKAEIKDLTDEQVMEIQFIENIEREDVHPMDEAHAFNDRLNHPAKAFTVEDIAARINKSITYVKLRLLLLNLIPELQKCFWDDKFYDAHAVQMARLEPDGQKLCYRMAKEDKWDFGSPTELRSFIEKNVQNKLSAAPFKLDDAHLDTVAGPCTGCNKRTGANVLFKEENKDDRCLDRKCFDGKCAAFLNFQILDVCNNKPDIGLMSHGNAKEITKEIRELAARTGTTIYDWYSSGISSYKNSNTIPFKALVINSTDKGKIKTFYKSVKAAAAGQSKNDGPAGLEELRASLAMIEEKKNRNLVLDYEKVQERIAKRFDDLVPDDVIHECTLQPANLVDGFVWLKILDSLGWHSDICEKVLGNKDLSEYNDQIKIESLLTKLSQLSADQKLSLVRSSFIAEWSRNRQNGFKTEAVRFLAKRMGVDVDSILADQAIVRSKREANAEKRRQKLADELEALEAAKPKAKKTAAKPAAKKGTDKKTKTAAKKRTAKKQAA